MLICECFLSKEVFLRRFSKNVTMWHTQPWCPCMKGLGGPTVFFMIFGIYLASPHPGINLNFLCSFLLRPHLHQCGKDMFFVTFGCFDFAHVAKTLDFVKLWFIVPPLLLPGSCWGEPWSAFAASPVPFSAPLELHLANQGASSHPRPSSVKILHCLVFRMEANLSFQGCWKFLFSAPSFNI